MGIRVRNIQRVGGFTREKRLDRYGALEKSIDEYHNRQIIVYVVLDNEGRVPITKEMFNPSTLKALALTNSTIQGVHLLLDSKVE